MKIIDSKCWSSARRFVVPAETAQPEERSFTVSGSSTGPGIFELFLGEGASPSTFEFLQTIDPDVDYGDGTWSIPLTLEAGQYTLEARANHLHPDSNHQATDSSTFTVSAPDPANITTTYDSHGRVETRSWASGDVVQTFGWDGQGHLLSITQIDTGTTETVGSYIWTAQYDGFGRRFQTDYAPDGAHAITIEKNRIKTWFDPQVEYMVAAVEHHGKREWMVHGPDLDTGYGSFQGLGGLEAIVDEATGQTTPIVDTVHGHVVATIDLGDTSIIADDLVIYKEQQFGGYGPLPSSEQQPLEVTESLAESLGWQTRCVDPTSFFAMGARHYDPLSGRFLSADPLGHAATPDLYSYAGGDPLNFFDPTGRNAVTEFAGAFYDEYIGIGERVNATMAEVGYTLADMYVWSGELRATGDIDSSREPFSQTFNSGLRETVTFAGLGYGPEFDAGTVLATTEMTVSVGTLGGYNAVAGGYDLATGDYQGAQDQFVASTLIAAGGVRSTEVIRSPRQAAADQSMVNQLVETRAGAVRAGTETGNATYATGSNARGNTGVYESVPGRVHAEPQVLNNLKGGSQRTVAVDQYPCANCQSQLPNGTRVVVPGNPLKPGQSPKSAARNAARGNEAQSRVLPRDSRGYVVDPTGKYVKP